MKKLLSFLLFLPALCLGQVSFGPANSVSISANPGGGGGSGPYSPTSFTANNILTGNGTSPIQSSGATITGSGNVLTFAGGSSLTDSGSGQITVAAGAPAVASSSTAGLMALLTASNAVAGNVTAGAAAGGAVTITAGNAARLTSGNANGGNITLTTGTGIGTGTGGSLLVTNNSTTVMSLTSAGTIDLYAPSATNAGMNFHAFGGTYVGTIGNGGSGFTVDANNGALNLQSNGVNGITINGSVPATTIANDLEQSSGTATTSGAATTGATLIKNVTGIADATATTVLTITIPNAAHSAKVRVTLNGSLGAGGAIGANEASGAITYDISITRTSGVNANATISSGYGSATSHVAGAATVTITAALGAVGGAVGATNTYSVQVTIAHSGGSSTNHTCLVEAELLNVNASGITLS